MSDIVILLQEAESDSFFDIMEGFSNDSLILQWLASILYFSSEDRLYFIKLKNTHLDILQSYIQQSKIDESKLQPLKKALIEHKKK
jgi:hypothetical protein